MNKSITITLTPEDLTQLHYLVKSDQDKSGILTHLIAQYNNSNPGHYTFTNEEDEFEAGIATTRLDVYCLLDNLKELVEKLNYQVIEDHNTLVHVNEKLTTIFQII